MSVSFQLDHLVIAVTDLQHAIEDYRQLGFNVIPGGRHQHAPTQNALVYFADGTYLELIEWTAPAPGEKWYEHLTRHGEGLVDFAFVPSQIGTAITQAEARGVHYRGPIDGSRVKPTGEEVRWQLGWPASHALPFLCGDITPRSLRVPGGPVREHQNQACGITSIAICVDDLQQAAQAYRGLLGADSDALWSAPHRFETEGLEVLSIQLGRAQLLLVAPLPAHDSSIRQALETRGQGVYRLCVAGVEAAPSTPGRLSLSHGVSLLMANKKLTLLEQISGHD